MQIFEIVTTINSVSGKQQNIEIIIHSQLKPFGCLEVEGIEELV